ncbi:hypothetical protein B6S12_03910 [Helicobacter valdiviensis]|uniref:Uncharacterized protein n=1 Tax=Helicobacter valdiviensis TaxID=1458358 RepID=A0A2W6MVW0_9HELI|nr:hypothetical protein [Helicobacter valdiviensis]PZT48482.1 hypothetical protein B6S12_03910 [Helicobacter valdiviensis]
MKYLTAFLACLALFLGFLYKTELKENENLELRLSLENANTKTLSKALEEQNKAFKALEVKQSLEPLSVERVQKVFLKDTSCQSELEAYKSLFLELGKN